MRKVRFIWMFFAAALLVSISGFAFAEQLTVFKTTLDQVDISRDGGRKWVTLVDTATEFDLIALSGGNASQWFSNVSVPAGTYNAWRVHVIAYEATVTGITGQAYISATATGTMDAWESGTMNATVDAAGNTSAIWRFDAESSYTVHGADSIELDPQITVE